MFENSSFIDSDFHQKILNLRFDSACLQGFQKLYLVVAYNKVTVPSKLTIKFIPDDEVSDFMFAEYPLQEENDILGFFIQNLYRAGVYAIQVAPNDYDIDNEDYDLESLKCIISGLIFGEDAVTIPIPDDFIDPSITWHDLRFSIDQNPNELLTMINEKAIEDIGEPEPEPEPEPKIKRIRNAKKTSKKQNVIKQEVN